MKCVGKSAQKAAVLAAGVCAVLLTGCATVEQNMAEQRKLHVIAGKEIHVPNARGYQFCEVAPIYGTSKGNAVANFYNPTGIDHCTPEQFAQLDAEKITKEMGARQTHLNPSRQWVFDEVSVYEVGEVRQFGPVKFAWMAVVGVEAMEAAVGEGHYHPVQIHRNNTFVFKKGTPVYLLDTPDGRVLVMQSWTNFVNKGLTMETLKDLGSQFKQLPPGWKFRTKVLDRDLTVAPPPPNRLAWVTQDEFQNTYQGCGYDAACNYTP
jgi:hypothetical protein